MRPEPFWICEITGKEHPDVLDLSEKQIDDWRLHREQNGLLLDHMFALQTAWLLNAKRNQSTEPIQHTDLMLFRVEDIDATNAAEKNRQNLANLKQWQTRPSKSSCKPRPPMPTRSSTSRRAK